MKPKQKIFSYRICIVPMCRNSGRTLNNWTRNLIDDPDYPCPRHKEPTSKCQCTVPFKIFPFPVARSTRRRLWIDLLQRPKDFEPNYWHGVCSCHFVNDEPNDQFPFPILDLGLERWQFEDTLKTYCSASELEVYSKLTHEAIRRPSTDIRYTKKQGRANKPGKKSIPKKKPQLRYSPYQPLPNLTASLSSIMTFPASTSTGIKVISTPIPISKSTNDQSISNILQRAVSSKKSTDHQSTPQEIIPGIRLTTYVQNKSYQKPDPLEDICATIEIGDNTYLKSHRSGTGFAAAPFIRARNEMDQHAYHQNYQSNNRSECANQKCKRTVQSIRDSSKKIAELDGQVDIQKRAHQSYLLRLQENQKILIEQESLNMQCVQCQRITSMYHRSTSEARQMERSLTYLGVKRFNLQRDLFKLYGEKRSLIMMKLLTDQEKIAQAAKKDSVVSDRETGKAVDSISIEKK